MHMYTQKIFLRKLCESTLACSLALLCACSGYSITGGPGQQNPQKLQVSTKVQEQLRNLRKITLTKVEAANPSVSAAVLAQFDEALRQQALTTLTLPVVSTLASDVEILEVQILEAQELVGGKAGAEKAASIS